MARRLKLDNTEVALRERLAFRPARLGRNLYLVSPFPPTLSGRQREPGKEE